MKIAFDVDDTLIIPAIVADTDRDVPNYDNIAIYRWFQLQGAYMIVWSGGGKDYARMWGEKLGLAADEYRDKSGLGDSKDLDIDIAFDDCDVDLAKVNVKVKRLKNSIDRRKWNDHKNFSKSSTTMTNKNEPTDEKTYEKCEMCGLRKPDVHERPNAYANDVGNDPDATHVVCDECDYENKMDI